MLWLMAAAFVFWMFLNGVRRKTGPRQVLDVCYSLLLLALSGFLVLQPVNAWRFENRLANIASQLADGKPARVECLTVMESIFFAGDPFTAALGSSISGDIEILPRWCKALETYIDRPQEAGVEELWALNLFTHEAMHARGETNEAKTNCQAVQRNYRAAQLLGVPEEIARQSAVRFYTEIYLITVAKNSRYFSADCAPGKRLDERLQDSTWSFLSR